jgi:two-component system nitrogen regulation response regulator GlnG
MNLLIVDDEQAICWGLKQLGEELGHRVRTAASAEEALRLAAADPPEAVVLDVRLPGMDGLTAMRHLREHIGARPIIVITAHGDLQTAVQAVQQGAFEYIVKPFDLAKAQAVLERAAMSVAEVKTPPSPTVTPAGQLVGKTPIMQEAFRRIALVSASDACVLITGESGTGKELAARAIHQHSRRAKGPFVPVNVAALSETLAESELFGHVRGAFTGASDSRVGLLQQAHGGTLFLDEVADIPLATQAKLLRVLEQRELLPVGSSQPVKTDFRMLSATHQDLQKLVEAGKFRHDLYFRLCAFEIYMPPLRQRSDDIPLLVEHFLQNLAGGGTPRLSREAMSELRRRPWYGNVRELRNAVEHALVLARDGVVTPDHLPPPVPAQLVGGEGASAPIEDRLSDLVRTWAERHLAAGKFEGTLHEQLLSIIEQPLFEAALAQHHGQYSAAARSLGIHRTTLKKKVDEA